MDRKWSQSIGGMLGRLNSQNPIRSFIRSDTLTQGADDFATSSDVSQLERWLKFNDTHIEEVNMTDEFLQQECFGGSYFAEVPGRPPEKRTRNYSAYLLFYQRVPSAVGAGVQLGDIPRSRRLSESSTKRKPSLNAFNIGRNRHSSLSVEKPHFPTLDEGRFQKPRFSVDEVHTPVSRGSHRSIQFSRPPHSSSMISTAYMTHQQRFSLGPTSNHLRASPIAGARLSSTCLFGLANSSGGINDKHDSWTGDTAAGDLTAEPIAPTTGITGADAPYPADEMLHRIRKNNLAFLRDQSIFSPDYVSFVYNLAQGVLADSTALQLEPARAIMGCHLVANFLFATYLALHASVKVSISPGLCKCLLGLCAPPPQNGAEKSHSHHHQTSAAEQASLQEAGTKLDTHWMQLLLRLMTANAHVVSWSLGFFVQSPTIPILNYMLACPKPLLRNQMARLVGMVLSTFYASKDASILDAALNSLVDYLLDLLSVEVPQYAHHCGSYFGLLRGYVETCPHASVHLSNRSGTRRLLRFLIAEDAEHEETLSIDTGALLPASVAADVDTGPLSTAVSPQKDAGFPTWASCLRNWTVNQSKELGNYYLLLAHMLLQSNFDQFRNYPLPLANSHPSRLRLFPRPETARWLGFSNLAVSSDALCPAAARGLHPRLRYVGMFLLVESIIRSYVENPHTPTPPQRQHDQQQPLRVKQSKFAASSGKSEPTPTPAHRASLTSMSEEFALRDTMVNVLNHLTQSWWIPSAAFISLLLSLIVARPLVELRHYFDLIKHLLRVKDELQSQRVLAFLCGLQGPAWHLRPNFQSGRMENESLFGDISNESSDGSGKFGADTDDSSRYPPPPDFAHPGILFLLTGESSPEIGCALDSRRAYQCIKFLVELASENSAVVEGLSRFPQLWGPAVEWLESLLEESDKASSPGPPSFGLSTSLGRHSDLLDPTATSPANVSGRLRSGTFSGATTNAGKPKMKTSSHEDESWGLKRTSSAQTTLTEAARMLATMPGYDIQRLQTHREIDHDSPEHVSSPSRHSPEIIK